MEADPEYTAPLSGRSFSIGPGDMIGDESNLKARYEASWRMFRDLEQTHGTAAVQNWVTHLTSRPGRIERPEVVRSGDTLLHEELDRRLE